MAYKLGNRVKVSVSGTPGTGSITLGSALTGFVSFATAGIADTDTVPYVIEDGAAWEIGVGTYSSTGPTLARTTITASSNSNAAISATANAIVMLSPLAADLQSTDTLTSGTLPVARGGTGLSTLTAGYIPFGAGTSAFGNSANLFWDNTNARLGIGTSSPANKLVIYQNAATGVSITTSNSLASWIAGTDSSGNYSIYSNSAYNVLFSTNGSERMRIRSDGAVAVGGAGAANYSLLVTKDMTGSTGVYGNANQGIIQSDVTSSATYYRTYAQTAAASFTLVNMYGYLAEQGTIGAGSTVTNQYGFHASSGLTGATNNYGFFSNIASGTGRWNFYAAGTADNYFAGPVQLSAGTAAAPAISRFGDTNTGIFFPAADTVGISTGGSERLRIDGSGNVGIGATTSANITLRVNKNITGGTTCQQILSQGVVQSDVTSAARGFQTFLGTANATFTLAELTHYFVAQDAFGASSTVTNQFGFNCGNITGATNNYGFYSNIASGTGRWNFYANGTADNYFAGNVGIGTSSPSYVLDVQKTINNNVTYGRFYNPSDSGGAGFYLQAQTTTPIICTIGAADNGEGVRIGAKTNHVVRFITNDTERLRIDSSGNVGIGTSSPSYRLEVRASNPTNGFVQFIRNNTSNGNGCLIAFDINNVGGAAIGIINNTNALGFYNNSSTTERMRIDGSGNLLVGTTSVGTSAVRVIGIADGTAPTTSPTGMGQLYVEAGALKYRGSSGTVTTIAAA